MLLDLCNKTSGNKGLTARRRVNHAPVGTFVRAEERYTPSRQPKTRNKNKTMNMLIRQMMIATRDTRHVVIKVTKMTIDKSVLLCAVTSGPEEERI